MDQKERGRYKAWSDWVAATRATGGVADGGYETVDALRGAFDFCFAVHYETGHDHNEMAQLGFKWVSAYMVSCAKHGDGDLLPIFSPNRSRQKAFQSEAARNVGLIATNLSEAANIDARIFASAMAATGATLTVAPTGKGKGWGYINE